jgi:hypothetical protein
MSGSIFPDLDGSALPESPQCPFCEGRDTRLLSAFGGQLSVAQCWCNHCRTGFEYLKWGKSEPAETRKELREA